MPSCTLCRQSFKTEQALRQHTENSPAHAPIRCSTCNNKTFPHASALAQHTRDAPAHRRAPPKSPPSQRSTATLPASDLSSNTSAALSSTTSAAPRAHARPPNPHPCPHCPRTFATPAALAQHARDSPAAHHHRPSPPPPRGTPLDAFFLTYQAAASFAYDRACGPAASFAALRRHMGWRRGSDGSKVGWSEYQDALRRELEVWFGAEDDLANWHALCRAVGVVPLPEGCEGCERALRGRHVNLVDLVEWARKGEGEAVEVFGSVRELADYCDETKKYFLLDLVENAGEAGDGNVVIRHLLRKFWGGGQRRVDRGVFRV